MNKHECDYSIGSIHESNNYGPFEILELDHKDKYNHKYFRIKFLNTGYEIVVQSSNIKTGNIRDHSYNDILFSSGSIYESNRCGSFKILELDHIDEHSQRYYKIQFIQTGYITIARASCIKNGEVRDPFTKTVCNVGYLGMEKIPDTAKFDYNRWLAMIRRCYDQKDHAYSNYGALGVSVCERWHCFKNYLEDMQNLNNRQEYLDNPNLYHLDKDILQQGIPKYQQIYSPETCQFIYRGINAAYRTNAGINSITGYYGVSEYGNSGKYITKTCYNNNTYNIGVYPNLELAAAAYNQFILSHCLNKPLNPIPPITQAQVYDYDLRFGNKIEMCKIVDKSKPKEMCIIIDKNLR